MRHGSRFARGLAGGVLVAVLAGLICGCPAAGNRFPVADAGADQVVDPNQLVVLNGSASSDPDGETLTFNWSQIMGTAVTLGTANAVSTTFIAPSTGQVLQFRLTVRDPNGLSGTDTVNVRVDAPTPAVQRRLYVANVANNSVTSYADPNTASGDIAPASVLIGTQTGLTAPTDVVVDANDALVVSNFGASTLTVYGSAPAASGNQAPVRTIGGASTFLAGPTPMAISEDGRLVFVGNLNSIPDTVAVFPNVSGVPGGAFDPNGNVAPVRVFASNNLDNPIGMNLDDNDTLYVVNAATNVVAAFKNASTLNGTVVAARLVTSDQFFGLFDVFVDDADRLYVLASATGGNRVFVFNNASALDGQVLPNSILTVSGAINLTSLVVDSAGIGYIVDNANNAIYVYTNLAVRNGLFAPDRTIRGTQTQLAGPIRLHLVE